MWPAKWELFTLHVQKVLISSTTLGSYGGRLTVNLLIDLERNLHTYAVHRHLHLRTSMPVKCPRCGYTRAF